MNAVLARVEMQTTTPSRAETSATASLRTVRHCPECGSPLIASPILQCAHCGEEVRLRCFVYARKPSGHIAECVDLDLSSQGNTPEEAIGRLQEAIVGYLQVAFEGGSTRGLVLRRSPLRNRLRYYAHCTVGRLDSLLKRRHARHLLPDSQDSIRLRLSHCR